MSLPVGEWARAAGHPVNRLDNIELAELDRFEQMKSQAVSFSKEQNARYQELIAKARGEQA